MPSVISSNRPWQAPAGSWLMHMTWYNLLFAHWPLPASELLPHIPPGLELELFGGSAWIGVVPFGMSDVRARHMPAILPMSKFLEINVRTYVTRDDKPGVYFFSLDAADPCAVALARRFFHLNYFDATISMHGGDDLIKYESRRTGAGKLPGTDFRARYRPLGEPFVAKPGTIEHFLTARYCLYSCDLRGALYRGEIDHEPWQLQDAQAEFEVNTMTKPLGITLPGEPLLHFSRRLQTIAWAARRLS